MTMRHIEKTWRIGPALLALACLLSLLAPGALAAAEGVDTTSDAVEIAENGTVTLISDHIAGEQVASVQLQIKVGAGTAGFDFAGGLSGGSRILHAAVHAVSEGNILSIYIAGASPLLTGGDDRLVLGMLDGGNPAEADFVDGSLKYVYGNTMRVQAAANMEGESLAMAGLKDLIAEAEAVDAASYTADSYAALLTALAAAKDALANTAATDEELQAAADVLHAAIDGLTANVPAPSGPSKDALQAAVNAADQYEGREAEFTKTSWDAFFAALAQADAVLRNEDATAEEINAALQALQAAQNGLMPSGKGALADAVSAAKALLDEIDESLYTPESVQTLKDAVAAAQDVLIDETAGDAEWAEALAALTSAMDLIPAGEPDPDDPIPEGGETDDPQQTAQTEPTPTPTPTATATATATAAAKTAPNTGDETLIVPWLVLLALCGGMLILLTARRRQER